MTKHELKSGDSNHDFASLVSSIESIHHHIQAQTAKSVNVGLTVRNWLIGCYISEYELKGADRAEYGERLLDRLAEKLTDLGSAPVKNAVFMRICGSIRHFPRLCGR